MTQKRITRATARPAKRERGLQIHSALVAHAKDPDDAKVAEILASLVEDDADGTANSLFVIASLALQELAEATDVPLGKWVRQFSED